MGTRKERDEAARRLLKADKCLLKMAKALEKNGVMLRPSESCENELPGDWLCAARENIGIAMELLGYRKPE